MSDRSQRMKAIHAGARELGLDDDARRALMERITGCRSAKDMTDAQMGAVLEEYSRLRGGARRAGEGRRQWRPATNPLARKVHAQWAELCRLGVVNVTGASARRQALRKWCARQLQPGDDVLVDPDLLEDGQLRVLVESLKKWLTRLRGGEGP